MARALQQGECPCRRVKQPRLHRDRYCLAGWLRGVVRSDQADWDWPSSLEDVEPTMTGRATDGEARSCGRRTGLGYRMWFPQCVGRVDAATHAVAAAESSRHSGVGRVMPQEDASGRCLGPALLSGHQGCGRRRTTRRGITRAAGPVGVTTTAQCSGAFLSRSCLGGAGSSRRPPLCCQRQLVIPW